jgi:YD repeat-containing protein
MIVSACSESDTDFNTENPQLVLLRKSVSTAPNGTITTNDYTYSGNKLLKINSSHGWITSYTYTGDLITKIETIDADGRVLFSSDMEYNTDAQLVKRINLSPINAGSSAPTGRKQLYTHNADGTIDISATWGDTHDQIYPDTSRKVFFEDGEVSRFETYMNWLGNEYTIAYDYTYDNKNYPLKNVLAYSKISIHDGTAEGMKHNIIVANYSNSETPEQNETITTEYEYNSAGYPIRTTDENGYLLEYFY